MSIEKIHLRTLLRYFGMSPDRRLAAARADARAEIRKRRGGGSSGGDFHTAFWSDCKGHTRGELDLRDAAADRVERNKRSRSRLYPPLAEGFLNWWNEKRRWINEEIEILPQPVNAPHHFAEIDGVVKVENLIALSVGRVSERLIYPYFSETPVLTSDVARLGLWLMSQALPSYRIEDMRVLDVLRGEPFSVDRYPLQGNEGVVFVERYARMLADWRRFMDEFR